MSSKKIFTYIAFLSIFGLFLSIYLLFQQWTRSPFQPCNINSFINCNAIISGDVAKTFGISTPLFGLVGYLVILISALYMKPKLVLYTSIFGLLFCLFIAYKELFLLHVICPVCILCQITMIGVLSLGILLNRKKKKV
jgi:uncharacterized membrane protein